MAPLIVLNSTTNHQYCKQIHESIVARNYARIQIETTPQDRTLQPTMTTVALTNSTSPISYSSVNKSSNRQCSSREAANTTTTNTEPCRKVQTARKHTAPYSTHPHQRKLQTARKHTGPYSMHPHQRKLQTARKHTGPSTVTAREVKIREQSTPPIVQTTALSCTTNLKDFATHPVRRTQPEEPELTINYSHVKEGTVEPNTYPNMTKKCHRQEDTSEKDKPITRGADKNQGKRSDFFIEGQGESFQPGTVFKLNLTDPQYITFRGNVCRSIGTQTKISLKN